MAKDIKPANLYVVKQGDSWESIAARFYGNASLGRTLAGQNGANEDSQPSTGAEIVVPGGNEDELQRTAAEDTTPAPVATKASEGPSGGGPTEVGLSGRKDVETIGETKPS